MNTIESPINHFLKQYSSFRWVLVLIGAFILSMLLFKLVDTYLPKLVRLMSNKATHAEGREELIKWRRRETFLHVIIAASKIFIFFGSVYLSWRLLNPGGAPVALVTASAVAVILLSAIFGPLLRDVAYGVAIIAERWYNVGDHIKVEPFADMRGVVESVTLRSTTIRGLGGEIIKVHNQHIQAIRMTPMGVKNLAIDIFVNDLEVGKKNLSKVLKTIPQSATMVKEAFTVKETEKLAQNLWRITASGKLVAGREWLIEDYAVDAMKSSDNTKKPVIVYGPIVRSVDTSAVKRFMRSVGNNK